MDQKNQEIENKLNSSTQEKNQDTASKINNIPKQDKDLEKIKELTETLQRLQAEFENYQKRTIKSNQEYKEFATAFLIEEILPVLDTLEQGIKHNKEFALIYEQLYMVLKKNGLEKINTIEGEKFDHEIMDCLMKENSPLEEDKVVKVLLNGYFLNKKILRPVKVSISSGLKENKNEESKNKIVEEKIDLTKESNEEKK